MPFSEQTARRYTKEDIESLKENQVGVYGLFKQGVWIYVGKGDIRQRLLAHLNGDIPCIKRQGPTSWVVEVTARDPSEREKQLIRELDPVCNKNVG